MVVMMWTYSTLVLPNFNHLHFSILGLCEAVKSRQGPFVINANGADAARHATVNPLAEFPTHDIDIDNVHLGQNEIFDAVLLAFDAVASLFVELGSVICV